MKDNSQFRKGLIILFLTSLFFIPKGIANTLIGDQSVCENNLIQPLLFEGSGQLVGWEVSIDQLVFYPISGARSNELDPELLGPITQNLFIRVVYEELGEQLHSNVVKITVVSRPIIGNVPENPIVIDYGDSFEVNLYSNIVDGSLNSFMISEIPDWISYALAKDSDSQLFGDFSNFENGFLSGIVYDGDAGYYVISSDGTTLYYILENGDTELIRSDLYPGTTYSLSIFDGYLYIPRYNENIYSLTRIPLTDILKEEELFVSSSGGFLYLNTFNDELYASTSGLNAIVKVKSNSELEVVVGASNGLPTSSPLGFDFDGEGNIYIATGRNSTIMKFDGTSLSRVFTGPRRSYITSVQLDFQGNFFVSFSGLGVRKYNSDFSSFTTISLDSQIVVYNIEFTETGSLIYVRHNTNEVYNLKTGIVFSGTSSKNHLGVHEVKVQVKNGNCSSTASFFVEVVDRIPPLLVETKPLHEETNVDLFPTISFKFDEEIKLGTSGFIKLLTEEGLLLQSFLLSSQIDLDYLSISQDQVTLNLNLKEALPHLTKIVVSMDPKVILDLSNNEFVGLSFDKTEYFFTTRDKLPQVFSFDPISEKTYGDDEFVLGDEFTDKGNRIEYIAEDPSIVSISGNRAKILGVGNTVIHASQKGDSFYYAAPTISRELIIKKAELLFSITPEVKEYDGTPFSSFSYDISGWAYDEDESVISGYIEFLGDALTGFNVGTYGLEIGFEQLNAKNYFFTGSLGNFQITPADLKITALSDQGKIFGEMDPILTYTSVGWVNGEDESILTGGLTREEGEESGSYSIQLGTLTAGSNYSIQYQGSDFEIRKRMLSIKAIEGQSKVYGELDADLEYTVTGFVEGDSEELLIGSLDREEGESVGSYWITQGDLSAGKNYQIDYVGADFEIRKKSLEVIVKEGQSKKYGEGDPYFSYSLEGFIVGDGPDLISGHLSRVSGESVGDYAIGLGTLSAGANYSLELIGADFSIFPNELTVIVNSGQRKIYGSEDPVYSYVVEGLQFSESALDVLDGSLDRTEGESIGKYVISQGDLSSNYNYTIHFISNEFEITPKVLQITALSDQGKIYGQSDPILTYTSVGWVNGEDESILTGGLTREEGEDSGSYSIQLGTLTAGSNYSIQYQGSDFEIRKRMLSIKAVEGQNKVYGELDTDLEYTVTGFVEGDSEELITGSLDREEGESVGSYWINQGDLSAGKNYQIDYVGADFEIRKKQIEVIAEAGQFKIYGQDDIPFSYLVYGILERDKGIQALGALGRQQGENVGLYQLNIGTLSFGINYEIVFVPNVFEILPKTLTVIADSNQRKVYGQEDPQFTFSIIGLERDDTEDIIQGRLTRILGESVGNYELLKGSITAGDNYHIEYISNQFEIWPKELHVFALPDQYKFFGDEDPELKFRVEGLAFGDSESSFSGKLTREQGENVGIYNILQGSLEASKNYKINFFGSDFSIRKKLVKISLAENLDKIYGESDPDFQLVFENSLKEEFQQLFQGLLVREQGEDIGHYDFYLLESEQDPNFQIEFLSGGFEILKRDLFIIPDSDQFKFYKEPDPDFTYKVQNLASWDTESVISGKIERIEGESVGYYSFHLGLLSSSENYTLILKDEKFEIKSIDRDQDGVPDHVEEEEGTNPNDAEDFKDSDKDGAPDFVEKVENTNPFDPSDYLDSDGDGVPNWIEILNQSDPYNSKSFLDKDGNGVPDYIDNRSIVFVFEEVITVPWGSTWSDLNIPDSVSVVTSYGDTIKLSVVWNQFEVDFFKNGNYPNDGELNLIPGLFNPKNLKGLIRIVVLPKPMLEDLILSNNTFKADQSLSQIYIGDFTVIDLFDSIHFLELIDGALDNSLFSIIGDQLFWSSKDPYPGRKIFKIKVRVLDRDGNSFEKEFLIYRIFPEFSEIVVFNTFTPNHDGINETWGVPSLVFFEDVQISILDRGGRVLFYSNKGSARWNGTFLGLPMPIGSYYWVIKLGDTNQVRRGFLNLLRD